MYIPHDSFWSYKDLEQKQIMPGKCGGPGGKWGSFRSNSNNLLLRECGARCAYALAKFRDHGLRICIFSHP